jgi:hypothetical protein
MVPRPDDSYQGAWHPGGKQTGGSTANLPRGDMGGGPTWNREGNPLSQGRTFRFRPLSLMAPRWSQPWRAGVHSFCRSARALTNDA